VEEDSVVRLPRPGASVIEDPLLAVLRNGARRMLTQALEAEVEAVVAAYADLVDEQGRRRVVRNGHAPERQIQTGIGPIELRRPRVRDRGHGGAEPIRFTSEILPPYLRRTRNIEPGPPSGLPLGVGRSCCRGSTSRVSRPGSSARP
jgi:putative transposase